MVKGKKDSRWQDTLYIWDGIVTVDDKTATGEKKESDIAVSWEGTWVPVDDCPDATNAPAPKRNAFAEYVDSDFLFSVSGTASIEKNEPSPEQQEHQHRFFVSKLADGDGWDMEESGKNQKYQDKVHDVLVKTLRWSGNMFDQTENLIVAKGQNEFGSFISAGWMRPGNRWTLARRYLSDENDPRAGWPLQELHEAIVKESVVVENSGQRKLSIPPWQNAILHVEYKEEEAMKRGEKRKIEEDETPNKEAKQ
jgi:hypothetical protein